MQSINAIEAYAYERNKDLVCMKEEKCNMHTEWINILYVRKKKNVIK